MNLHFPPVRLPTIPLPHPVDIIFRDLKNNAQDLIGSIEDLIPNPVHSVIRAVVGQYIDFLRRQGDPHPLSGKLRYVLQKYYSQNMDLIVYYEGIDTKHGHHITLGNEIFFTRKMDFSKAEDVHVLLHEIAHVDQYKNKGGLGPFIQDYLIDIGVTINEIKSINVHDDMELEKAAEAKAVEVFPQVWEDLKVNSVFILQTGTPLENSDDNNKFLLNSANDLFLIKRKGASNTTEVHILSAASNYQIFTLHTATCLHPTDETFDFALDLNNNLFAFKKQNTGTGTTEIHILSAAHNYQQFSLHTGTALHLTDENYQFMVADNNDVFFVKKRGDSGNTELHALSAASNYQNYSLHIATALHLTDASFEFMLAPNNDLYIISKQGASNSSELHVLSAASNYQIFTVETPTILHQTDANFQFTLSRSGDIVAIKKKGESSTEVHRLRPLF